MGAIHNPILTKTRVADGAITKHRIVKPGSDDDSVAQASAATDALMAVATELAAADTERVDVTYVGVVEVEYGGNVTRGQLLTSDADGKAIAAAPATGANMSVIGRAVVSGVSGDIGSVHIAPGQIQGA